MFLTLTNREELIKYLPKGGVVAEIGVKEGDFSANILASTEPRKLHLIDPWMHEGPIHGTNCQADKDREADGVAARFAKEIAAGQVVIERNDSHTAAATFADDYFDWIYIDGNHTYDFVHGDLQLFFRTVKSTGFILGHDYTNHPAWEKTLDYGVVRAVNEFVLEKGCLFLALTYESAPSYALSKAPAGNHVNDMAANLLAATISIEFRGYPANSKFMHRPLVEEDGITESKEVSYFSF